MQTDFTLCRHIKTNGRRCQSPSLTGRALCFFHQNLHRAHNPRKNAPETNQITPKSTPFPPETNPNPPQFPPITLQFPPLEDAESIQLAISLLFKALAAGHVDPFLARTLLYALQLASTNVRAVTAEPSSPTVVRSVVQTKSGHALAAPGLGNGHQLPEDEPISWAEQVLIELRRPNSAPPLAAPPSPENPHPATATSSPEPAS